MDLDEFRKLFVEGHLASAGNGYITVVHDKAECATCEYIDVDVQGFNLMRARLAVARFYESYPYGIPYLGGL